MNKSTHFSGQPAFSQLLSMIPREIVLSSAKEYRSDYYDKRFDTWHHLVTMLFACYGNCSSLREVVTGMRALEGRLQSGGLAYFPARSTFSEANTHRNSKVFEQIYTRLKRYWSSVLPDSRAALNTYVIDSTVITLFQEIFKGSGSCYADGRRKGGLKVHMAVPLHDAVPAVVHISDGASHDTVFSKQLNLPVGSTVIMDRGYRDYKQYNKWSANSIRWITRPWTRVHHKTIGSQTVPDTQKAAGIRLDRFVMLGYPQKKTPQVKARWIDFTDPQTKRSLQFITNDLVSDALTIAQLYKKRWGIELLFKRLKQNMPLHYFLGDTKNAIQIQIWCALIADLLLNVLRSQLKRRWAFSSIASLIRLHLFNYLNLLGFLENPEAAVITSNPSIENQLKLNLSG